MINQVYRLVKPRQIKIDFVEEKIGKEEVVVRPKFLSICKADIRYYAGNRDQKVLDKKLPMALIHEAVGEVIYDPSNEFPVGSKVVMIPNTPMEKDSDIRENYQTTSKFRASGYDGFMQEFVVMRKDRIIRYNNIDDRTAVLLELFSVCVNAIDNFQIHSGNRKDSIGIWGNGNIGFITALILKKLYPKSKILLFGPNNKKMDYFSFVDGIYDINSIDEDVKVDHAFECVGGPYSENAINQIIDHINPQGTISLMGVSENLIAINTRDVLEKGLILLGNSRSGYQDFKRSIEIMEQNDDIKNYLKTIISDEVVIRKIDDINLAFNIDLNNDFKTIMEWKI